MGTRQQRRDGNGDAASVESEGEPTGSRGTHVSVTLG